MISIETDFYSIKSDWERLYSPDTDTVFQSFSYNEAYWRHHVGVGELALIVYRDSGSKIKAILPTYIRGKQLRFINDGGTDFCDIIFDRDLSLFDVVEELVEFIGTMSNRVNIIALNNLRESSPLLPYFKVLLQNSFIYSSNEYSFLQCNQSEHPFDSIGDLPHNKRKKLIKILEKSSNYPFVIYNSRSNKDFPENELRYLVSYMVRKGWRDARKYNEVFWDYIRDIYDSGQIEVGLLFSPDNNPLSAGLVFSDERRTIRWIIFYTDKKYNLWNNVHYINSKAKSFSYENNFGRGGYDYKIVNFRPKLGILYYLLVPLNQRGRIIAAYTILRDFLKRSFRGSSIYRFVSHSKIRFRNSISR